MKPIYNNNIILTDINLLKPYAKNSRKHSADQIKKIVNSIKEFGFTNPILIKDNTIIAGHARLQAAQKLKLAQVPTLDLSHLSDVQAQAYVIADNRLSEISEWDLDLVKMELKDLIDKDFDISLTGFDDLKLDEDPEEATEDEQEEFSRETSIVLGDLIQIGQHRLVCGDSTNPDHVAKVLDGAEPYLMITDPPYGVEYNPEWRNERVKQKGNRSHGKVSNDDVSDWRDSFSLSPSKVAYVYHGGVKSESVSKSLSECEFEIRSQIIWVKHHFAIGRGNYHQKHEPCFYAVKQGYEAKWIGDLSQTSVWEIKKNHKNETGHSTQKPVQCMFIPIKNHDGDVYDPFIGSGTTMIAAHQLNRICYGIEINPMYCQVIIDRMLKNYPELEVKINDNKYNPL